MIDNLLMKISNSRINKLTNNKFLEDIPNDFFLECYDTRRSNLNGAILLISVSLSLLISIGIFFYDIFLGFLILFIIFLLTLLFLIRRVRKKFLNRNMEVEQFSDFICSEILLILITTESLPTIIEYLSKGSYPIISTKLKYSIKEMNLGKSPIKLLEKFADEQPSDTLKEFIFDLVIPFAEGRIKINKTLNYESQWRIRQKFEVFLNQLEGKTSIFLAITTIIPLTVSMMLVILGYLSFNLILFLPIIFLVFDLIAVEFYNSGKIELLGGK